MQGLKDGVVDDGQKHRAHHKGYARSKGALFKTGANSQCHQKRNGEDDNTWDPPMKGNGHEERNRWMRV